MENLQIKSTKGLHTQLCIRHLSHWVVANPSWVNSCSYIFWLQVRYNCSYIFWLLKLALWQIFNVGFPVVTRAVVLAKVNLKVSLKLTFGQTVILFVLNITTTLAVHVESVHILSVCKCSGETFKSYLSYKLLPMNSISLINALIIKSALNVQRILWKKLGGKEFICDLCEREKACHLLFLFFYRSGRWEQNYYP